MFPDDVRIIFGYSRGVLEVFGGVPDVFGGVPDVSGCFLTDSQDVQKIFLIFFDDFWNFTVLENVVLVYRYLHQKIKMAIWIYRPTSLDP